MIQRIAFDYGRTLFDRERNDFFPEVSAVLKELSKNYSLSIISYSKPDDIDIRISALRKLGVWELFKGVWFVDKPELKHSALDEMLMRFHLQPEEVAVVDDYVIRGIAWANERGATSIWFRNGKFSSVEPSVEIGKPNFEISSFGEILGCLAP